jgi:hypothetical protein
MEKKTKIIIGLVVIALIVVIGIFISLSVQENKDSDLTNVCDLMAYPQDYVGKEVKVKGGPIYENIHDTAPHIGVVLIASKGGCTFYIKTETLLAVGEYYFTGTFEYENIWPFYYLNVTKVEAIT